MTPWMWWSLAPGLASEHSLSPHEVCILNEGGVVTLAGAQMSLSFTAYAQHALPMVNSEPMLIAGASALVCMAPFC